MLTYLTCGCNLCACVCAGRGVTTCPGCWRGSGAWAARWRPAGWAPCPSWPPTTPSSTARVGLFFLWVGGWVCVRLFVCELVGGSRGALQSGFRASLVWGGGEQHPSCRRRWLAAARVQGTAPFLLLSTQTHRRCSRTRPPRAQGWARGRSLATTRCSRCGGRWCGWRRPG